MTTTTLTRRKDHESTKNRRKVLTLLMLLSLTAALAVVWDATHAHAHRNMRSTAMEPHPTSAAQSLNVVTSDAVVLQWNEIAVTTIGAQPPFLAARFMATAQVAVFEAVNAITGEYEPYLGTIRAPQGASPQAAAVAAAYGVLKAFFPAQGATLDQQRADSLATIPDGRSKTDGIAVGEAAAAAMVANRTNDGTAPAQFHMPPNSEPYEWQTTAGCPPGGGAFKHWPNVKPFGIESSSQFRADAPPKLKSGTYARDFNEVRAVGDVK